MHELHPRSLPSQAAQFKSNLSKLLACSTVLAQRALQVGACQILRPSVIVKHNDYASHYLCLRHPRHVF